VKPKVLPTMPKIGDIILWVNSQREQRNLPALKDLPKGVRSKLGLCPIAVSLSTDEQPVHVASWGWTEPQPKDTPKDELLPQVWHELPSFVADFIRKFDEGIAFQEYHV